MATIAPRFSVGSINATRDPRIPCNSSSTTAMRPVGRTPNEKVFAHCVGGMSLIELTVNNSKHILSIPDGWLLAHQFIYVVDGSTDPNGWQYCHYINNNAHSSRLNKMSSDSGDNHHSFTEFQPNRWFNSSERCEADEASKDKEAAGECVEPRSRSNSSGNSMVRSRSRMRRRLWMATIVPAEHLSLTKRLLFENLKLAFSFSTATPAAGGGGTSGGSTSAAAASRSVPLLQGELMRYEKGTLTKSWQLRTVSLFSNRLEFYSGASKKGEVLLTDCEVKLLFPHQLPCPCPSPSAYAAAEHDNESGTMSNPSLASETGGCYAFSIRNPLGSVGILLDAGSHEARVRWVLAIQYQLALHSADVNFAPFQYGPPVPFCSLAATLNSSRSGLPFWPSYRVLLCGTVCVQVVSTGVLYSTGSSRLGVEGPQWSAPQTLQLLPGELVLVDPRSEALSGRLPLEKMVVSTDERGRSFTVRTAATGICLIIDADIGVPVTASSSSSSKSLSRSVESPDGKGSQQSLNSTWLLAIRKQIYFIDNQKLKMKTSPKEEQLPQGGVTFRDRLQLFYADSDCPTSGQGGAEQLRWTAPPVDGLSDEYLHYLLFAHKPFLHPAPPLTDSHAISANTAINSDSEPTEFVNEQLLLFTAVETVIANNNNNNNSPCCDAIPVTWDGTRSSHSMDSDVTRKVTVGGFAAEKSFSSPDAPPAIPADSAPIIPAAATLNTALNTTTTTTAVEGKQGEDSDRDSTEASKSQQLSTTAKSTNSSTMTASTSASSSINAVNPNPRRGPQSSSSSTTTSSSLKRSLINPKFILSVLKGITHRFVLVLECERRRPCTSDIVFFPPRFTVGGPKACKDPRITPLTQLLGISNRNPEIQLPAGWLMLHQYIYIVQPNTDEAGWQYRSNWSDGIVTSRDEQWLESAFSGPGGLGGQENMQLQVRRRLWMTTVVRKDDVIKAKKLVSENLVGSKGDIILQGLLYKYQPESAGSGTASAGTASASIGVGNSLAWQKRKVLLFHNKLEFFIGNDKKGEASLVECEVKMLFPQECPGRRFAFSVRNPSGSVDVLLDAESKETRLRWVAAVQYQLAVIYPDVNFAPFAWGPPTGCHPDDRVLLCGDLLKLHMQSHLHSGQSNGGSYGRWVKMHFQLRPHELLFFEYATAAGGGGASSSTSLKGRLLLEHAVIRARDKDARDSDRDRDDFSEHEFSLRSASGITLMLRAASNELKVAWIRALKRHAQYIENEKLRQSTTSTASCDEPLPSEAQRLAVHFDHDGWTADKPTQDAGDSSSLQELEQDMAFLLTRKRQYGGRGEIWDTNTFDCDGPLGEAAVGASERLQNRRQQQQGLQQQLGVRARAQASNPNPTVTFSVQPDTAIQNPQNNITLDDIE